MQEQDPGRSCDLCMACAGAACAEILYCMERTHAGAGEKCAEEEVLEIVLQANHSPYYYSFLVYHWAESRENWE